MVHLYLYLSPQYRQQRPRKILKFNSCYSKGSLFFSLLQLAILQSIRPLPCSSLRSSPAVSPCPRAPPASGFPARSSLSLGIILPDLHWLLPAIQALGRCHHFEKSSPTALSKVVSHLPPGESTLLHLLNRTFITVRTCTLFFKIYSLSVGMYLREDRGFLFDSRAAGALPTIRSLVKT